MAENLDSEARRTLGRVLWSTAAQDTGMSPEDRKKSWADEKSYYVKHANKLMQSLSKRGYKIVKG